MRKLFPTALFFATVLALTPIHASRLSDSSRNFMDGHRLLAETPVPETSPIIEFWQNLQSSMAEELQELSVTIEAEFRVALEPTGEAEPDWKIRGVDVPAYLQSLPGGIDNNAVLTVGDAPGLQFFGAIPADILVDWDFILAGSKAVAPTNAAGGVFLAISPVHIVFVADNEVQTANARCTKSAIDRAADHLTVYRYASVPFDPNNDQSIEEEAKAVVMHHLIGSMTMPIVCSIFEQDQEGHFRSYTYLPDGRPLAKIDDENDRLIIVSNFNLYQQLSASYSSAFADDDLLDQAEAASDPS